MKDLPASPGRSTRSGKTLSRRRLIKAAWASPFCITGSGLLQGCTKPDTADALELGVGDIVAHIRNGAMKAEFYVTQLIKQYHAHKDLNAIVTIAEARLLEQARAVDQRRQRGEALAPLAGLPFAVKDQADVAGYPNTAGNGALSSYIPKRNAVVVDALVKSGGIVFAKTNLPDMVVNDNLMAAAASSNRNFGQVRNPYDLSRSPGGSSGGNGAAIAARVAPCGIGEDTGGSVRFPAAFCGIAGLRPSTYTIENLLSGTTRKRYSSAGMVPPPSVLDTWGPMARTIADVAILDAHITGQPVPTLLLRDARIGIPAANYWDNDKIDQGVAKTLREAFAKLRDAGAQLVEIDFTTLAEVTNVGLMDLAALTIPAAGAEKTSENDFAAWLGQNAPGVTMEQVYAAAGRALPPPMQMPEIDIAARNKKLAMVQRQHADVFAANGLSALAFPTMPVPATPINPAGQAIDQKIRLNGNLVTEVDVIIMNLFWGPRLGAPELSLPAGLTEGLPVGLSLQALPGHDSSLLATGIAVEGVLGRIPAPAFRNA